MPVYHCELAWLGGESAERDVLVAVDGDRITAVETAVAERPEAAIGLPGLTVPGLANAHSHAFHRVLRGRTHRGPGSFWTWREQISPGCYADLTTIGLDSVRTTGTRAEDAAAVAVFAATAADVRHVVIGGRVVVADGRHTSIDVVGALRHVLR